ncbi:MAG: Mth938-like domain-containing protein [Sphingobium sp.]
MVGFSGHGFRVRIGEQAMLAPGGLLISPVSALDWKDIPSIEALQIGALDDLLAGAPTSEFLLLGTGARLAQPPRSFVRAVEARGMGVEVMDSRAAARAWGVLRAEERPIIGALMPL